MIAKAREGQFDEKSLKDKECDRIEEHSLSNLDASLFIPTNQSNKGNELFFLSFFEL